MKVIADRAALLEAINLVAAVVPQRTPSPALSCVKLTAARSGSVGELTLAGTDAEHALSINLTQVDVTDPGVAVVNAHKLQQIVQNIDQGDPTVSIELDGDLCTIKGTNSRFKIMSYPSADFPPLPDMDAASKGGGGGRDTARAVFTHSAGGLLRLIARTIFATARETSRYAINGVLLKRDGKKLEMVATDGRRLALCRATARSAPGDSGTGASSCIIPTKALNLITRLAGDAESSIRVAITDNRVFFAFIDGVDGGDKKGTPAAPRAILSSALVEGAFPPYEDVIPKDHDKRVGAATDELARAVRQASVLTNEESRGVRLAFSGKSKQLKISSRAPEMGESEIQMPLSEYAGEDLEISFNPQFISDALKAIDEVEVKIDLKAPNKPGVLRAGDDFLYVVMPVNLPT